MAEKTKRCIFCQKEILLSARTCEICGKDLTWRRFAKDLKLLLGLPTAIIAFFLVIKTVILPKKADLTFSMSKLLNLEKFDLTKPFQIAEVSGEVNIINNGNANAVVDAILVENTGVASQLYFFEGCGSTKIDGTENTIAPNGNITPVKFSVKYKIGIVPQLAYPFEVGHVEHSYNLERNLMLGGQMAARGIINGSANVYVFWTDKTGSYVSVARYKMAKNAVRYILSPIEEQEGGLKDMFCFDDEFREIAGLPNITYENNKDTQSGDDNEDDIQTIMDRALIDGIPINLTRVIKR